MKIGLTGTYSSGKTYTSLVVSKYLGVPRTEASTMREILPHAAPGKTLEECTAAQLIQMIVVRHSERVVHEKLLSPEFISDGCSLQEWIYGSVRVKYGAIRMRRSIWNPMQASKRPVSLRFSRM